MEVAELLLDAALATGTRSIVVVGTGKNVGKTVAIRAIYRAARQRGIAVGLTSIGRDGEANDIADAIRKPRLRLGSGTLIAGAAAILPRSPALEWRELLDAHSASGTIAIARVRSESECELVGAASASSLRASVAALHAHGAQLVLIDGAVDRIAAIRPEDAVIVSCGAAHAASIEAIAGDARALVTLLALPECDPKRPHVSIAGALTAARIADLLALGEEREIVVADPTRVALRGRALLGALERLNLRVERALHPIGVTINSVGRAGDVEPDALLRAVRQATGLPTIDVVAGRAA